MKMLTRTLLALLLLGGVGEGSTPTDVTSSKNELLAKGSTPHVRFVDDEATGDYTFTINGGVARLSSEAVNALFNVPDTGTIGVELEAPQNPAATPASGGTLNAGTYFYVVTALDGFGETIPSDEVSCTTSGTCPGSGNCQCDISWTLGSAQEYRVYQGTATGQEDNYDDGIVTNSYSAAADPLPNAGSPPEATSAYSVRLSSDGVHFPDGTVQSTAGAGGAWAVTGSDITSAQSGNVGIGTGTPFVPDAKLTVLGGLDINDRGAIFASATNNFLVRSNYQTSDDTLWNTGQSSWSLTLGNAGDAVRIDRAPSTAGTPAYANALELTTTDFTVTMLTGETLKFEDGDGVLTLTNGTNLVTASAGNQPFYRLDTSTETMELVIVDSNLQEINTSGTTLDFTDFTNILFEIRTTAASNSTNISILSNASTTPQTVSLDANDSCGSGFRCLRVPN